MQQISAAVLALLLAGCTEAGEPRITAPDEASTATTESGMSLYCTSIIAVGGTGSCWVSGASGFTSFTSSAPGVVSVGYGSGALYGNSAGWARITAYSNGVYAYAFVDVVYPNTPPSVYITGPGTITTAGTYTWTANPSGGNGSYTYSWETYNGSSWTYRGSGKTWSTSLDWSGATFQQVRVTVTSNGTASATQNVSIGITRPPPGVYISGPGSITVKGTYAFTANPSNFETPSYAWEERFCTNGSCDPWSSSYGIGQTYNRTLGPVDCSVNQATWQLRVVVSGRSDGLTAQDVHTAHTCTGGTEPID